MRKFKGTVVFRYYQDVTVEIEDEDADDDQVEAIARALMCEEFELRSAEAEMDVLDLEEVK